MTGRRAPTTATMLIPLHHSHVPCLPPRLQALNSIAAFGGVSNHTQWALSEVLGDEEWTAGFLQQNQRLLERSYDALTGELFIAALCAALCALLCKYWLWFPALHLSGQSLLLCCTADVLAAVPGAAAGALEEAGIPFLPAVGGMFVWVDMR